MEDLREGQPEVPLLCSVCIHSPLIAPFIDFQEHHQVAQSGDNRTGGESQDEVKKRKKKQRKEKKRKKMEAHLN